MQKAALWYARHGWRVLPCIEGKKEPAIKAWQKNATSDERQVKAWWDVRPRSNIGIACGPGSGLAVLDVDKKGKEDGEKSLVALEHKHGELPRTIHQMTGSGGFQFFYRYPEGRTIRNSCRSLGKGLDTRGDGGFVIVPPSVHPSGGVYEWMAPPWDDELAELESLPEAWIKLLEPKRQTTITVPIKPLKTLPDVGNDLIEGRLELVARMQPGARNDTLYKAAFFLASKARTGLVNWDQAKGALMQVALGRGLDQVEVSRTLRSAEKGSGLCA